MHSRLIPVSEITDEDEERWRALADASLEANPVFEPELLRPASRHVLVDADLFLVVVEKDERFEGCLPLRLLRRWRYLPLHTFTSRLDINAVPVLPVLGTPLIRPDHAAEVTTALLAGVVAAARRQRVSLLVFERLNESGASAALLRRACDELKLPFRTFDAWERPVLKRGDDSEVSHSGPSHQRLKDLAKKQRRLARATGGEVLVVDRGGDPMAVEDLLRLEASGWKGREETALLNHPNQVAFFRDSCDRLRASSKLHMLTLEAGGTVVAMCCCELSGDTLFLLRIAYDDEYARFSPGAQLELATTDFFRSSTDATLMDTCCAPNNQFHSHFLPDRLQISSTVIALNGAAGVLLHLLPYLIGARRNLGKLPRSRAEMVGFLRRPVDPNDNRSGNASAVDLTLPLGNR